MNDSQLLANLDELNLAVEEFATDVAAVIAALEQNDNYFVIGSSNSAYPAQLRDLESPPPVIFGVGNPDAIARTKPDQRLIAIAGARRASAYGREVAYSLSQNLAMNGHSVVSGMNLGCEGAAARGALSAGGTAIAVMAGGPDIAYPRSHKLLHEQVANASVVISRVPFGVDATREDHELKKQLIATLADAVVLAEATTGSASLLIVTCAYSHSRGVFAVPGAITSPLSSGANSLIYSGIATPLLDTEISGRSAVIQVPAANGRSRHA